MRFALGIVVGITSTMLAYILFQPALDRHQLRRFVRWMFMRVPVDTHADCKPKYRTCHNGVWTEGPWT